MENTLKITGSTKVAGLFGIDTSRSQSPFIHNFIAKEMGHDCIYATFNVTPDDLALAVDGAFAMGIEGLNITNPHKVSVMPMLAHIHPCGDATGAVNLLKYTKAGYEGYNTDVYGIEQALAMVGIKPKTAVVLGLGGGAKAVQVALKNLGCGQVVTLSRKQGNMADITKMGGELLVQATSATPQQLLEIAPPALLGGFGAVFDLNYPAYNPWLDEFNQHHVTTTDGLAMLVFQAVKAYEILWGQAVPDAIIDKLLKQVRHG